ncbi:MAG: glycosyltransferase family 1 protein [Bacteroidales bacterium]
MLKLDAFIISKIMNIAINTRLLLKNKMEGIGWFTYETVRRIVKAHPEHTFYFIFDRPWHNDYIFSDNVIPIKTKLSCRHPLLWYFWFNHCIPHILKKHKIDLFVSPDGHNVPKKFKSYIVVHDINFVHFPKNVPILERKYYQYFFPKFVKNANRLGTVSEFSRIDICSHYGTNENKIDILCNGASDVFKPVKDDVKEQIKKEFSDGNEFFLFVGALNPRKNIGRLLDAFELFCEMTDNSIRLVIAGKPMFSNKSFRKNYEKMRYKHRVHFIGRQRRDKLGEITASAFAMVFPSTFEGFGIPIIEAMNCDIPVITSNITSMPEVAGDAAIKIDPYSVESIAEALITISKQEHTRKELIEKGKIQRQKYSWEKAAKLFWEGIEKCFKS